MKLGTAKCKPKLREERKKWSNNL